MLDWLALNHEALAVTLNAGMLVVWIAYLQVFVSSYRRQIRASILINIGSGNGLDARCLVSNMSSDPIYLVSIVLELETPQERLNCPVTELDGLEEWDTPSDLDLWTRQGPLEPGRVRDMGAFRAMLDHALRCQPARWQAAHPDAWARLRGFEVQVVAVYGSEDLPVGARRRFALRRDGKRVVFRPETAEARQIRSRRERRAMRRALEIELRETPP